MSLFDDLFSKTLSKMSGSGISRKTLSDYFEDMKKHQNDAKYLYDTYFKNKRVVYIKDKKTLDTLFLYIKSQGIFKEWFHKHSIREITSKYDIRHGDECLVFLHTDSTGNSNIGIFTLCTPENDKIPIDQLTKTYSYGWLYYPDCESSNKYCLVKYKWDDSKDSSKVGLSVGSYELIKY